MRRLMLSMMFVTAQLSAVSVAADDHDQSVIQDLGATLGWRLAPQLVEEQCRSVDPGGADARKKLLQTWVDKNDAQIKAVDAAVAEIAPLLNENANGADMVQAVRRQVASLLQDSIFEGKKGDEIKDICKKETDPANPRWTNSGMPDVQQSLAAMYDWKIRHGKK
jgi:hypothetical protein